MRVVVCILYALLMTACAISKTAKQATEISLSQPCPKGANCSMELLTGKKLEITHDNFGAHYTLVDDLTKNVLRYKHDKIVKGNLQDAFYKEEVIFELPAANTTLENAALQKTQMLFGRFCYCKGQTGYYAVREGKLEVKPEGGTLDFTVSEVPQITKRLVFSLK